MKNIFKFSKRGLSCLVAISILLTTVFSVISIKDISTSAEEDITYWDGNSATAFAGGDGTKADPFLIENGAQLAKAVIDKGMNNGAQAFYRITKDIYLNEDYANYKNWGTNAPANNWGVTYSSSAFTGNLDGGYHTIYGMYYSQGGSYAGLVAYLSGTGATIHNLIITNSYVNNTSADATALFAGRIDNGTIQNCIARDSYLTNKNKTALAGIAAWSNTSTTKITNCAAYGLSFVQGATYIAGILSKSSGGNATVSKCFSGGTHIFARINTGSNQYPNIACSDSYTDVDDEWKNGVSEKLDGSMQGANALTAMSKLASGIWKATDTYPTFSVYNGKKGEVWSGSEAYMFAGGKGTQADPYLIETPEQLYKAVKSLGKNSDGTAAYYLVTEDIYLNENYENYANWNDDDQTPANNWSGVYGDSEFIGNLDGGYHTVYGMYYKRGGYRAGFIPWMAKGGTVSNITISYSFVRMGGDSMGVVVGRYAQGTISNTIVHDCLLYSTSGGNAYLGGIVGASENSASKIENCGAYNLSFVADSATNKLIGGILGRSGANNAIVNNCYSAGTYIFGSTDKIGCTNSYTDVEHTWKNGVKNWYETPEKLKGANAVVNMGFSFAIWKPTDSYPVMRGTDDGVKGQVWNGKIATKFAGGTGTQADPYLIETAAQLYKAISSLGKGADGNGAYYLVIEDIYLNEDYDNYASWGETAPKNNWVPTDSSSKFIGHLDGDGHTVYGLYIDKKAWCAGLIPRMQGGSVRDINVAKAYIHSVDSTVGAIVGLANIGSNISRCKAYDAVIVDDSNIDLGGICGAAERTVMITGCATYNITAVSTGAVGGILGRAWGSAYIRESFSIGLYPVGIGNDTYRTGCLNVYTDTNTTSKSGITVLNESDMKGENAFEKMPLLDTIWKTDSVGYPVYREYNNGVKGEIWTGAIAENYAGGTGTEADPYLIETGEQLYKLVFENCIPGKVSNYYKVVADIRLNNTDGDKWYKKDGVNKWHVVHVYSFSFPGHFDGNGHTVAGIYTESEEGNAYTGLIPILDVGSSVKDVGVIDSYIATSSSIAENFTGGIVGWIDNWDISYSVTEENIPVISGCFVDETVYLSGMYCGGILSGVAAPVLVENCYFTGKFDNYSSAACIVGNTWTQGTKISHCYAANSEMKTFAGGQSVNRNEVEYEACYNFGKGSGVNFYFVSLYDIRGEKAATTLVDFDFENIWKTVDGGTPVLRAFGEDADKFSFKDEVYSTVSFITNVTGMSVEPIRGLIDSPITLPKPTREGYVFAGWYVYSELQCEYTYDTFPFIDLILYAKWVPAGVEQDFENYPNTEYDLDSDYVYFRPGVANYDGGNVHGGNKALKRLGNSSERQDFLVKYEEELDVGKEYTISFWMMTETKGATGKVSMLNATWPDIAEPVKGDEVTVAEYKNLSVGEWKLYKYKFTATTPWVSLRTDGDTVLYFDDILIYPNN